MTVTLLTTTTIQRLQHFQFSDLLNVSETLYFVYLYIVLRIYSKFKLDQPFQFWFQFTYRRALNFQYLYLQYLYRRTLNFQRSSSPIAGRTTSSSPTTVIPRPSQIALHLTRKAYSVHATINYYAGGFIRDGKTMHLNKVINYDVLPCWCIGTYTVSRRVLRPEWSRFS